MSEVKSIPAKSNKKKHVINSTARIVSHSPTATTCFFSSTTIAALQSHVFRAHTQYLSSILLLLTSFFLLQVSEADQHTSHGSYEANRS